MTSNLKASMLEKVVPTAGRGRRVMVAERGGGGGRGRGSGAAVLVVAMAGGVQCSQVVGGEIEQERAKDRR